jgi:hypothetical protein
LTLPVENLPSGTVLRCQPESIKPGYPDHSTEISGPSKLRRSS